MIKKGEKMVKKGKLQKRTTFLSLLSVTAAALIFVCGTLAGSPVQTADSQEWTAPRIPVVSEESLPEPDESLVSSVFGGLNESQIVSAFGDGRISSIATTDVGSALQISTYLPDNTRYKSKKLALTALDLCSAVHPMKVKSKFTDNGFSVVSQVNYEKDKSDPSHTAAYTVGKRVVLYKGELRTLYAVCVRGTMYGEWYSNFDFAPSRSEDSPFAENFLFAAEDVFWGAKEVIDGDERILAPEPLFLVTGHSRGGAVANLLGLLFNAEYGTDNVFCYTFASPNTRKKEYTISTDCRNIFNYIGSSDIVPLLPFSEWGYERVGVDVKLDSVFAPQTLNELVSSMTKAFTELAPTVGSYYGDRHSLTGAGLSEEGITPFELMAVIVNFVSNFSLSGGGSSSVDAMSMLSSESDFAPFMATVAELTDNNYSFAISMLIQHMPITYKAMIKLTLEL